jgi:hypothetical protein
MPCTKEELKLLESGEEERANEEARTKRRKADEEWIREETEKHGFDCIDLEF